MYWVFNERRRGHMAGINIELKVPFDKKIGVLCGGLSNERDVSLRSGKNCLDALKRLGYQNAQLVDVDRNIADTLKNTNIEIAYIALHGKYGEDGCIQGLLEILDIPYTGSGVQASSVAMDKDLTKNILKAYKIPVIDSVTVSTSKDLCNLTTDLEYPVMVKPLSEGSSIGMAKVNHPQELVEAVDEAAKYNTGVMIEKYIQGKSLTVGVLDMQEETVATPMLEFKFKTKTEWYDYEAKYTEGRTHFILPAEINDNLTKTIQNLSIDVHKVIGAKGMSRVDFIIDDNGNPFVIEINTIPGMTDLSDLPAQANNMGITYDNLVAIILNSALLKQKNSGILFN